jgi:hypothetical protein
MSEGSLLAQRETLRMADSIWDIIARARGLAGSGHDREAAVAALRSQAHHPQYFPAGAVAEAKYLFDAGKGAEARALLAIIEERSPAYPGLWNLQVTEFRGSDEYLPNCRKVVAHFQQRGYISEPWLFNLFCEAALAVVPDSDILDQISCREPLNASHRAVLAEAVGFLRGIQREVGPQSRSSSAANKPWAFAMTEDERSTRENGETLLINMAKLDTVNTALWDPVLAGSIVRALQIHIGRSEYVRPSGVAPAKAAELKDGNEIVLWTLLDRAAVSLQTSGAAGKHEQASDVSKPRKAKASGAKAPAGSSAKPTRKKQKKRRR